MELDPGATQWAAGHLRHESCAVAFQVMRDFSEPNFPDIVSLIGDWFLTFDDAANVRGAVVLYFH
jgi:hypothetical protein